MDRVPIENASMTKTPADRTRMRCHFSVIFESLWKFWAIIIVFLVREIDEIIKLIKDLEVRSFEEVLETGGLPAAIVIVVIAVVILGVQFLRWRKTWITLDGNLLIYERNTLQKIKNTIALENISTVNIERTLFERVVGTSRIKIDTASLTTAKETDISIVFKEDVAVEFRKTLLDKISQIKGTKPQEALNVLDRPEEVPRDILMAGKVVTYKTSEMAMHCVYSASIFNILFVLGGIAYLVLYLKYASSKGENLIESLGGMLAMIIFFLGPAYNLVSKYVKYYNFRAFRDGDELHLRYGLLKLKSYTVPMDKIVSFTILQPTISRVFKKYQVTISTVGLADDNGETPNLTLASSRKKFIDQMALLLPEYNIEEILDTVNREAKGANAVRRFRAVQIGLLLAVAAFVVVLVTDLAWWIPTLVAVGLMLFICSQYFMSSKTEGWAMMEDFAVLVQGGYGKNYKICRYDKVQQIEVSSHPVGRKKGIVSGTCQLLNDGSGIPFMREEEMSEFVYRVIKTTEMTRV